MPFKNFSDFRRRTGTELLGSDFLVGYRTELAEYRTTIADLNIELLKNLNLQAAPEVLFVTPGGRDTNTGRSEFNSLRTIKRACAKALEISRASLTPEDKQIEANTGVWGLRSRQVNIFVRTGDYIEDNPIYLPPSCTIIGDNLRSTTIIPKNKFFDIFWVNNRCYIWGVTFRQHKYPSFAVAYPELRYLNGGLDIPYSTRTQTATAKAVSFYDNIRYGATSTAYSDILNLSNDIRPPAGTPIFDPARIAFLDRYFRNNLNTLFYTSEEEEDNKNFDETAYYNSEIRRPFQLTSPYTQGCSSITGPTSPGADDAGGGVIVDGYRVDGPLRSMVMDSFTQFNEGGPGIYITNNGYAQLVSTFTICCTEGVRVDNGGTCSINTSNCSFGLSGLVAVGKSPKATLVGELGDTINGLTNILTVRRIGSNINKARNDWETAFKQSIQPYPGQVFEIIKDGGVGEVVNNSGTLFTILSAQKVFLTNPADPSDGYTCILQLDTNYSPSLDTSNSTRGPIPVNSLVKFYIRSTITTSAHTMEYIGTGSVLLSAVPQNGGQTIVENEAIFDDVGRVFFTSTNQFGDFRIGRDLTIVQNTGTIEGETFSRSILQTTTPIAIALSNN